jgi:hypothetical protein
VIPVQFRAAAYQDIAEAVNWYEAQRAGLGARFFEDLDHVLSRIEESANNSRWCTGTHTVLCCDGFHSESFLQSIRTERWLLRLSTYEESPANGEVAFDV